MKIWKVVAASVVGVGHLRSGLPCQDAHAYRVTEEGLLVIAVADGAGSAERADVGAQTAVRIAIERLSADLQAKHAFVTDAASLTEGSDAREQVYRQILGAALATVRGGLEAIAEEQGISLRELATTLILVVASARGVAAMQVGDGAVVGRDAEGRVFAVTTPPEAEYANATTFVTSPDWKEATQWSYREGAVAGLAVFSDGLQRLALKLPEGTPHPPFFEPLFRFVDGLKVTPGEQNPAGTNQLTAFLQSPRITERADDDLTLVLAVRG